MFFKKETKEQNDNPIRYHSWLKKETYAKKEDFIFQIISSIAIGIFGTALLALSIYVSVIYSKNWYIVFVWIIFIIFVAWDIYEWKSMLRKKRMYMTSLENIENWENSDICKKIEQVNELISNLEAGNEIKVDIKIILYEKKCLEKEI